MKKLINRVKEFFANIFSVSSPKRIEKNEKYIYIFPDLFYYTNPDSTLLLEIYDEKKPGVIPDIKSLQNIKFLIVLSEPGNGKSRLLKEIALNATGNNFSSFFLDLKKIKNNQIENTISNYLKINKGLPKSNKEINSVYDFFASDNFKLSTSGGNFIACFDALDEVSRESQYEVIEKIKKFKSAFPNGNIIISCRDYIYKKFDSVFNELNPKIITVKPFSHYKVFEFLKENGFQDKEIEKVVDHFYRGFKINLIDNPRTLEIFVSIKEKEGLDNALKKSKSELLEHFIYGGLDEEDKKLNKDQKEIIKRVLEILALTMEIYQANSISKDELMTFFDDAKSNLTQSFLNQIKIEDFYERTLLIPIDDGRGIQFQNAEFQEFLAAKEITRLGKIEQAFYDFAVEPNLREIYPSWTNTIKYLIELAPFLQNLIVGFIIRKDNTIAFNILEQIILDHETKIESLKKEERSKFFLSILNFLNEKSIHLSNTFGGILSLYFTDNIDLEKIWNEYEKKGNSISLGNILLISLHLLEINKLENTESWKAKYIKQIKDSSTSKWNKDISIRALAKNKNVNLLKDNFDYYSEPDKGLKYTFINACLEIAANEPYTIDLVINSIVSDDLNTIPKQDFDSITTKEAFLYLINKLIENKFFLNHYSYYSFEKFKLDRIIENLSKIYDREIEAVIKTLVIQEDLFIRHNALLVRLIELLRDKNPDYIFELIESVKEGERYKKNWFNYNEIFEMLLTKENIEQFIVSMKKIPESENSLINLFLGVKNSSEAKDKQIFEITNKYFGSRYIEIEKSFTSENKRWDRSPGIYEEFKIKLTPVKDKDEVFMTDLFYFYNANKENIEKSIQPEEKERLKKLVRSVLKYDFEKATIKITSISNGTTSYSETRSLAIFVNAVALFKECGISLTEYRKKLIEYFPFFFGNDNCKFIFDMLPNLEEYEIDYLHKFYTTDRTDDVFKTNIRNLFNICKNYRVIKLIPVLKKFVFNESIDFHYRVEAIDVIHDLENDFDFYQNVFKTFKDIPINDHKRLAAKGNELLIKSPNTYREEAIDWRINEILNNPIKDKDNEDSDGFMDAHDIEFRTASFNKPLSVLDEDKYMSKFLTFLNSSVELVVKEKKYKSYVAYIWTIVMTYFDNLKKHRSMKPVIELENFILKINPFEEKKLLFWYLNNVKNTYITNLGKPSSYPDCIKKYNEIKARKYLQISTSFDLFNLIGDIINIDLNKWITQEGAYDFSNYKAVSASSSSLNPKSQLEDLIQKTIKTQFENFLLKRGLRDNEVKITREEQLLSDERTDFVISYGFIGQILLEIKLANSPQAFDLTEATKYKSKVLKYVEGTRSDYGIFLIFQTDEIKKWKDIEVMLIGIYKDENKLKVLGLNCVN